MNHVTKNKSLKLACCAALLVMLCMTMTACTKTKDIGDFAVTYTDAVSPTYFIVGISQSGKQKEELVIPSKINDIPVASLGSRIATVCLESQNLKKLFWGGGHNINGSRLITGCDNLHTLVLTSAYFHKYKDFFTEKKIYAFLPPGPMKIVLLDSVNECIPKECKKTFEFYYDFSSPNVFYKYGYGSSFPNGGYAWIDYLEPGDRIKTLPPAPQRAGYEFTGWYMDEQCTTVADFESIVKEDADINLYAGWEKI